MCGFGIWGPDQLLNIKQRHFENFAWIDDPYYDKLILSICYDIFRNHKEFQKERKRSSYIHLSTTK